MNRDRFYIDGAWQTPAGSEYLDVRSASTEEVIGRVPRGTTHDVDRAVAAARRAFDEGWSRTQPSERAEWLQKLAGALEARVSEIATTISQEVGMPITMSTVVQAQLPGVAQLHHIAAVRELKQRSHGMSRPQRGARAEKAILVRACHAAPLLADIIRASRNR